MDVVAEDARAVPERHLITAETLGDHLVEGMAELSEVLLPGHTGCGRHHEVVFPTSHQSVALEAVVLQMQIVDAAAFRAQVTAPLVHLVVVLQEHADDAVEIEVLLQEHQVVAFLPQVLADACRTAVTRTVRIDLEDQQLLGQSVNVERGNSKLLRGVLRHDGRNAAEK